jgi:hypothetical protein
MENAPDNFEVITTTDKAKRDQMFEDLRRNGDHLEKQVVKFSSNEPVLDEYGQQDRAFIQTGSMNGRIRLKFRSIWSIAYPRT